MNNIMSYGSYLGDIAQPLPKRESFINGVPIADDEASLILRQDENRLLNNQACIEYQLLKNRIVSSALEMNKFLEVDDQIGIQEYKLCTSLRYRKQFFAMEFKQLPGDHTQYNHALDLIFTGANSHLNTSGRTTLVLTRDNYEFFWRPLHQAFVGPAGGSNFLIRLVLLWLQGGNTPLFS